MMKAIGGRKNAQPAGRAEDRRLGATESATGVPRGCGAFCNIAISPQVK